VFSQQTGKSVPIFHPVPAIFAKVLYPWFQYSTSVCYGNKEKSVSLIQETRLQKASIDQLAFLRIASVKLKLSTTKSIHASIV
jgi:hypothetical protein